MVLMARARDRLRSAAILAVAFPGMGSQAEPRYRQDDGAGQAGFGDQATAALREWEQRGHAGRDRSLAQREATEDVGAPTG